jgi:hypothetical protein
MMKRGELAVAAGIHPRKIAAIRNGHARPRPGHREALLRAAGRYARQELRAGGRRPPVSDIEACRAWCRSVVNARLLRPPPGGQSRRAYHDATNRRHREFMLYEGGVGA